MKMPSRSFHPVEMPPDIFGLRHLTVLGEAFETDAERRQRIAKVWDGVAEPLRLRLDI